MLLHKPFVYLFVSASLLIGCRNDPPKSETTSATGSEATESGATPVTLTSPEIGTMTDSVELNAVSSFLLKTTVKSNATGYLQQVKAEIGRFVTRGQELFVVKTKEAQSLGNTITSLDSNLHFDGIIHIKSPGTGYITQLNYRTGDYVQDAEQLATITDTKSFVFILALPYELKPYLPGNQNLSVKLPDGTVLAGHIAMALPTVDAVSQTQNYVIKVNTDKQIPENLVAKVNLIKSEKRNTLSLPKSAVLSDEVQSKFWIMKLIDSTRAVKIPITKGLETAGKVEILSPTLLKTDKILLTGNYGLPDTANITVIKP